MYETISKATFDPHQQFLNRNKVPTNGAQKFKNQTRKNDGLPNAHITPVNFVTAVNKIRHVGRYQSPRMDLKQAEYRDN